MSMAFVRLSQSRSSGVVQGLRPSVRGVFLLQSNGDASRSLREQIALPPLVARLTEGPHQFPWQLTIPYYMPYTMWVYTADPHSIESLLVKKKLELL